MTLEDLKYSTVTHKRPRWEGVFSLHLWHDALWVLRVRPRPNGWLSARRQNPAMGVTHLHLPSIFPRGTQRGDTSDSERMKKLVYRYAGKYVS